MRICHIITGLQPGGAETMLLKLIASMDAQNFRNEVICLTGRGPLTADFEKSGVKLRTLGMKPSRLNPILIGTLVSHLRRSRPAIVQTWMYHADLIGTVAGKLAGVSNVIWNIRHSRPSHLVDKPRTIQVCRLCALLSHRGPKRIVTCSLSAARDHAEIGYARHKLTVIPNGFDTDLFRPDADRRLRTRRELGIGPSDVAIGIVGRYHPAKDHKSFIQAGAELYRSNRSVRFVFCGDGLDEQNAELATCLRAAGIAERSLLLGNRTNMPEIFPGFDIFALSSVSEGFPNALGEAMACSLPCVSTDVGDCAHLMGTTGTIVPPRNPEALSAGLEALVHSGHEARLAIGSNARSRIKQQFALPSIIRQYETLYAEVGNRQVSGSAA